MNVSLLLSGLLYGLVFSLAAHAANPPEKVFELEVKRGPPLATLEVQPK